ncbi:MAG: MlaE family lipid ABC transporter permease subunit [Myxococcales bacterium]|nr:MlaE family lipid ABC transporter permease subunit [Myxococcales bacterium]
MSGALQMERTVEGGEVRLRLRGRLDRQAAPLLLEWLRTWLPGAGEKAALDLSGVEYLDSAGVAVLSEALRLARERKQSLSLANLSAPAQKTLEIFRWQGVDLEVPERVGLFEGLGERAWALLAGLRKVGLLAADTFSWALAGPFTAQPGHPRGEILRQSILLGSRAFGIVALLSLLIGLTLALLSAAQLRQFGANIYAANLVAVAMTREMGPLLTAVIVAGRSGSAIAAEIATMRVTEEIDALESMGFSPVRFLVVPKLYAVTMTQPLLTLVADACGVLGGMLVGALLLQVPMPAFLQQCADALRTKDLVIGLLKSLSFGWIILLTGAHCGLQTSGGAQGVGISTTRSVVLSIFLVIVADCAFSLAFYS